MSDDPKRARGALLLASLSRTAPHWSAWIETGGYGPPPPATMESGYLALVAMRIEIIEPDAPPGWATLENVR